MYQHPYLLYLYGKIRQKELIETAQPFKLARQNRPAYQSFGSKIIAWTRARLTAHQQGEERTGEVLPVSGPCCTSAES